jgi:hypothetical protein
MLLSVGRALEPCRIEWCRLSRYFSPSNILVLTDNISCDTGLDMHGMESVAIVGIFDVVDAKYTVMRGCRSGLGLIRVGTLTPARSARTLGGWYRRRLLACEHWVLCMVVVVRETGLTLPVAVSTVARSVVIVHLTHVQHGTRGSRDVVGSLDWHPVAIVGVAKRWAVRSRSSTKRIVRDVCSILVEIAVPVPAPTVCVLRAWRVGNVLLRHGLLFVGDGMRMINVLVGVGGFVLELFHEDWNTTIRTTQTQTSRGRGGDPYSRSQRRR